MAAQVLSPSPSPLGFFVDVTQSRRILTSTSLRITGDDFNSRHNHLIVCITDTVKLNRKGDLELMLAEANGKNGQN